MARIRKDKGDKARLVASSSSTTRKVVARDVLRNNVIALGGTDADLDLIHDVGDGEQPLHGDGKHDAGLAKDVTKFLKELNFANGDDVPASQPQDAPAKANKSKKTKEAVKDVRATVAAPAKVTNKKQQQQPQPKKKADPKPKPSPSTSTPAAPAAPLPTPSSATTTLPPPPKNSKLLVQPTPDWYALVPPLSPPASVPVPVPTAAQIASLAKHAADLHAAELAGFASSPNAALLSSSSDHAFLKTILASGTLSDRLSALTLMVQSSPLHNTRGLDVLKGMAERGRGGGGAKDGKAGGGGGGGGRDERLKAARAIVDWWVGGGAPARKLKYFRDQPLLHPDVTDRHLLLWYFEDWLKKYFFALLQTLEALSLDTLAYVRTQALSLIFNLLREKPEQEHNLLRLLVNKLGDGEKSVCSRASYHILQLLQTHPVMKSIVIRETTALVMRPVGSSAAGSSLTATPAAKPRTHIRFDDDAGAHKTPQSDAAKPKASAKVNAKAKAKAKAQQPEKSAWNMHARYYAAITFNQVVLSTSEEDRKAARMLMDVYFQIFREVVGERSVPEPADDGDADKGKDGDADGDADAEVGKRGKREYGKGKAKAGPRAKEVQGAAGFAEVQDSNSRLVSAILTGVNRAMPFARFGGADVEFQRHMDTLFLITHTSTFNIALQALTLIQHILASLSSAPTTSTSTSSAADGASAAAAVAVRYFRTLYNTLLDLRLYESSKQAMYLNLLFKSVKGDADAERVRAFVKRFCQVLVGGFGGAEFVAGGLWLLGELFNTAPGLRSMIDKPAPAAASSTDGEALKYDPRKRDPQYAHASASPLWELLPLVHHAHPTISLLARQLLARRPLTTSPDLALHTLAHFLDRFVFKNPKKARAKGSSAMQPSAAIAAGEGAGVRRVRGEAQEAPVNEDGWWRRGVGSVPADQMFFHQYFSQKHEREQAKAAKAGKRKHRKDDSDAEEASEEEGDDEEEEGEEAGAEDEGVDEDEEDSDADEAEIWKAMKASMPELKGGDVDDDLMEDSDELPSGLDEDSEDGSGAELEDDEDDEDDEDEDMAGAARAEDDDAFSLVEASDAEDLLDLDEVNPAGLIEYDGSDAGSAAEEEWAGFGDGASAAAGGGKRKRAAEGEGEGEGKGKSQRKKRRSLPTFASYEDYAKMIEEGPEDNV